VKTEMKLRVPKDKKIFKSVYQLKDIPEKERNCSPDLVKY